jgi:hypothetical protein
MLEARRAGALTNRFTFTSDGRQVGHWEPHMFRGGGSLTVEGQQYQLKSGGFGTKLIMVNGAGATVATVERLGRSKWSITAGMQTFSFARRSIWSSDEELYIDGRKSGSITRASVWRGDADASLDGVPVPIQVLAVVAVLTKWARASSASGGGAA